MGPNNFLFACITLVITLNTTTLCDKIQPPGEIKFPDLFRMDDYYKCPEDRAFCAASLKLVPHDVNSKYWRQIEDWSKKRNHYNRTTLFRTMCIPQPFRGEIGKRQYVEDNVSNELKPYNLSAKMYNNLRCMEPRRFDVNIRLYISILAGYLTLVLLATIYDETIYDKRKSQSKWEKLLVCFSATNFMKTSITKTRDYQRLKCIQGIRTYEAIFVISGHTLMNFLLKNISNPEYVEDLFGQIFMEYILIFAMSVLQIFFFISMWLLTAQILVLHKENGKFTIKDGCLILVHRVARMWPLLAAMMFFAIPLFKHYGYGPGNFEIVSLLSKPCNDNWWITFLFATDMFETHQICHIGLWSLTIDIRLYIVTTGLLYILLKYKFNIKKSIAVVFLICYAITAILIYSKELSRDSWINLKLLTNMNIFEEKKITYIYFGFWSNSCSAVIGILFGYIYYRTRENPEKPEPFEKYYKVILMVLPMVSMIIASVDYSKFTGALIGPLFKPLFSLGVAVGIYGISRDAIKANPNQINSSNSNNDTKRNNPRYRFPAVIRFLSENKYVVGLGNFAFSTYIFHFSVVFSVGASSSSMVEISWLKMIAQIVKNCIISFAIGIVATITIELPGVYLKKLILPPVMRKPRSDIHDEELFDSNIKNKCS